MKQTLIDVSDDCMGALYWMCLVGNKLEKLHWDWELVGEKDR